MPTDTPTVETMVRKIAADLLGLVDHTFKHPDEYVVAGKEGTQLLCLFRPHADTPEGAADRERVMASAPNIAVRHVISGDTHLCGLVDINTYAPQGSWWGQGDTWGIAFVNAWNNRLDYLAVQEPTNANP